MTVHQKRDKLSERIKDLALELDGVIIDTDEGGFDDVCRLTIGRVSMQLHNLAREQRRKEGSKKSPG